jgi:hypothetical protein
VSTRELVAAALMLLIASFAAHADLDTDKLQKLTNIVNGVCNTVQEAKGKKTDAEIQGDVKAQLGPLSRLLGVGAEAQGRLSESQFEGLSQEATAIGLNGDRDCRKDLFIKLLELDKSASSAPAKPMRDPNGVYQFDAQVGDVQGPVTSPATSTVTFQLMHLTAQVDPNQPLLYQKWSLSCPLPPPKQGFVGTTSVMMAGISCTIIGTVPYP